MIHPELHRATTDLFVLITKERPTDKQLVEDGRIQDLVQRIASFYASEFNSLFPGKTRRSGQATIHEINEVFMISFSSSEEGWANRRLMTANWADGISLYLEASCEGGSHRIERLVLHKQEGPQIWLGFPYSLIPPVSLTI